MHSLNDIPKTATADPHAIEIGLRGQPEFYAQRRQPIWAFMFAAISAFIGMLYVGRAHRALLYLVAEFACLFLSVKGALNDSLLYTGIAAAGIFSVKMAGIIDTVRIARLHRQAFAAPWYSHWHGVPLLLSVSVLLIVFAKAAVFEPVVITGDSMYPGLLKGDFLIGYKWPYQKITLFGYPIPTPFRFRRPVIHRGDIILFKFPDNPKEQFIKRVIGLPGEVLNVNRDEVLVNDNPIERKRVLSTNDPEREFVEFLEITPRGAYRVTYNNVVLTQSTQQFNVPEKAYFVLGDNRDRSFDSRYWINSYVSQDAIVGKPLFIFWSSTEEPWYTIRWNRIGLRVE